MPFIWLSKPSHGPHDTSPKSRVQSSGTRATWSRPSLAGRDCEAQRDTGWLFLEFPILKRLNNTTQRTRRSASLQPAARSSGGSRRQQRRTCTNRPSLDLLFPHPKAASKRPKQAHNRNQHLHPQQLDVAKPRPTASLYLIAKNNQPWEENGLF